LDGSGGSLPREGLERDENQVAVLKDERQKKVITVKVASQ
jgi:hypothetical protein